MLAEHTLSRVFEYYLVLWTLFKSPFANYGSCQNGLCIIISNPLFEVVTSMKTDLVNLINSLNYSVLVIQSYSTFRREKSAQTTQFQALGDRQQMM